MKKRSALMLAGGIAVSLMAIVAALAVNLGALRSTPASAQSTQKPIVKTIIQTIHHKAKPKKAQASSGAVQTIVVQRPSTSAVGSSSGSSSSSHEFDDEGHESGDHGGGDD